MGDIEHSKQRVDWALSVIISLSIQYAAGFTLGVITGLISALNNFFYTNISAVLSVLIALFVTFIVLDYRNFEDQGLGYKVSWTIVSVVLAIPIIIAGAYNFVKLVINQDRD